MKRRNGHSGRRAGAGRKLGWASVIVVGFLLAAELAGWAVMNHTRLGGLAEANPAVTIDDPERIFPRVVDDPIEVPSDIDRLEVRDMSDPEGRENRVWLDEPPPGPVAVLVGGSSPLGVGLRNHETFWWMLDEAVGGDLRFLNVASVGDNSDAVRSQIARVVGFGALPRLVVIYIGDNEWIGFGYPSLGAPTVGRLDSILLKSNAYSGLRTLMRLGAQTSVYEDLETRRRESSFSLTRFPLDTRYRGFDARMRSFIDESRKLLLARFAANLEAVIEFSREHGAEVVMVTNPIKYRLSPAHAVAQVVTEAHAGTRIEGRIAAALDTAVDALLASDLDGAGAALRKALELDPDSSITHHYLGYLREAGNDPVAARRHFLMARERTIGGGGLMIRINGAIREVAARRQVRLVDLEEAFVRSSEMNGNGLADELVMDWCHPSAEGAALIFEELRRPVAEALRRSDRTMG